MDFLKHKVQFWGIQLWSQRNKYKIINKNKTVWIYRLVMCITKQFQITIALFWQVSAILNPQEVPLKSTAQEAKVAGKAQWPVCTVSYRSAGEFLLCSITAHNTGRFSLFLKYCSYFSCKHDNLATFSSCHGSLLQQHRLIKAWKDLQDHGVQAWSKKNAFKITIMFSWGKRMF